MVPMGKARCPEHTRSRERARGSAHQRGYDARWRKEREVFLRANPLCRKCKAEDRIEPATVVDHVIPHKGDQELFWNQANWQPLCKPHHDARVDEGDFGREPTGGGQILEADEAKDRSAVKNALCQVSAEGGRRG